MGSLRLVCRSPNTAFNSSVASRDGPGGGAAVVAFVFLCRSSLSLSTYKYGAGGSVFDSGFFRGGGSVRVGQRRSCVSAHSSKWTDHKSPYDVLEVERDADEEEIKVSYRRLAKFYHPDVYDGRGELQEGESAEARFIKIQAAYELLIDVEKRRQYDVENRVNPMKASEAWMEWVINKRKAFEQRGDMAIASWAEQQDRQLRLRARQLSRSKIDPEEERRLFAKAKKASIDNFNTTLRRHTLVLRKRDLMRKKAEEDRKKEIGRLLAAEGLELDTDEDV